MKIVVYAIAKNEEKFVNRWYDSMKEADEIYVLDTGSKDKTVSKLQSLGVHVTQKIIKPWRFDIARNLSLEQVPKDADICVCTDLDEVLEPGWRKILEKSWKKDTTRALYTYNWSIKDNKPLITFYTEKIHLRNGYKWIYPVHEILQYENVENKITISNIILNHYPDNNKSRSDYLELLELAVKENPLNDRNTHYLGREYMYYGKYHEAIDTLIKHLSLETSTWNKERCASMRFIARCYKYLKRYEEAKMWYNKAIKEAPFSREPYIELALLYYELNDYLQIEKNCLMALKITYKDKDYINETFSWDYTIYDLLSISYFNQKKYAKSLKNICLALEIDPNNKRLLENKRIIEKFQ